MDNAQLTMDPIMVVLTGLLLSAAVILSYFRRKPAALCAYIGMWTCRIGLSAVWDISDMVLWGFVALIATILAYSDRRDSEDCDSARPFVVTGALTGAIVGLIVNTMAGLILGAAVGAVFGMLAYSRINTRARQHCPFPTRPFWTTLLRSGVAAVVTMTIVGMALARLLTLTTLRPL